jgi:hypothetical protein
MNHKIEGEQSAWKKRHTSQTQNQFGTEKIGRALNRQ